jgi:hypothetical protein
LNFTEKDIQQIEKKGLTLEKVMSQIELFKAGLPYIELKAAATVGDGISIIEDDEKNRYIDLFESRRNSISILKFIPASGAATRMFKFLFHFLHNYDLTKESINAYINRNKARDLSLFLVGLEKLPFFEEVIHYLHEIFPNFNEMTYNKQRQEFIKTMLDEDRLNYSFSPKGLLPFHKYSEHVCTAFEEHLFEAALHASSNNKANLHFTISEKYNHKFDEEFKYIEEDVEEKTNTFFNIAFSYQKESTDTIAVTLDNEPVRTDDGSLLFRPSGHGALLENLNDFHADLIFIKNIDNVVVTKFREEVALYKKMLAGILLEVQEQAFGYQRKLFEGQPTPEEIKEASEFLAHVLNVEFSDDFENRPLKEREAYIVEKLHRPIRVCGMVKNEGEPGGGPFWVIDKGGRCSLQIVESAQVDKKNKHQKGIFEKSTHFNPVDLVCGIKDYKGEVYDLHKFVDPKTAFITMKTKTGKDIKALELPGLWNGSMANWNTIFVEVPLKTFNPVKTVNDLLKPQHQNT